MKDGRQTVIDTCRALLTKMDIELQEPEPNGELLELYSNMVGSALYKQFHDRSDENGLDQ